MDSITRGLTGAFRQIGRHPGLAAGVILTLGLAIGANTAIFSFVYALLIRPFPFRDADQLVEVYSMRGGQRGKLSVLEIEDIRRQAGSLESIAAHQGAVGGYNYSGGGRPEEWKALLTTGNLFEVLGLPMSAGSKWPESSDRSLHPSVVLSHEVWRTRFGGDPGIVGKTITLDHAPGYVVHGVSPPGIDFPRSIQIYRSVGGYTSRQKRDARTLVGVARIKQPSTPARFQAELDAVAGRLAAEYPDTNAGLSFQAVPLRDVYAGDVRPYLMLLSGAVAFVLLIACGNAANLLLSRAIGRNREMAVRVALGASRRRIAGQMLAESLALASIGALLGVALAWTAVGLLRRFIGAELPDWMPVQIDGGVLLFTVAISMAAGVLSGLAPAIRLSAASLFDALKEEGRGGTGGRASSRLRDWMIVTEVALAVVLLSGAGLIIRGFQSLESQDKGFDSGSVSTFRVALGWKRYQGEATVRYYEQALARIAAIPGVTGAALSTNPPMARQEETAPATAIRDGQTIQDAARNPYVSRQDVSESYFEFARIPLKSGRAFNEFDNATSEPAAIVSERLAKLLWPGADPVGQRILHDPASRRSKWRKVVGVAAGVKNRELGGEAGLDIYFPYKQDAFQINQYVLARTNLKPADFARQAERALWTIDPEQSSFDFQTWDERILNGIWQLRLSRTLLVLFSFVAMTLASIGIYGVMSYLVGQRTREMGIRLALGASPAGVRKLVVRRGMSLALAGMAVGMVGAIALGRVLQGMVRGIPGGDPVSYLGALAVLGVSALAACSAPAWRASRVDPAVTLRRD